MYVPLGGNITRFYIEKYIIISFIKSKIHTLYLYLTFVYFTFGKHEQLDTPDGETWTLIVVVATVIILHWM